VVSDSLHARCNVQLDVHSAKPWPYAKMLSIVCLVKHASLYNLQISPTRCTILLNIFISFLHMFRASMCPSSGENYYIYATLLFVTLYVCHVVCWLDWIQSNQQTRHHPYRVTNTSVVRIQQFSPVDGHMNALNM